MRSEILQDAFGNIDDDLVAAADVKAVPMKKKRVMKWVSGIAVACLVAVCAIVIPEKPAVREPVPTKGSEEDPAGAGGTNGRINISEKVVVIGAEYELGNEEAYAYLQSVSAGIQNVLKAMGVNTDGFRIDSDGYSHIRTGKDGNSVSVDWRDFLVYGEDGIIAVLSVTKDAAGLHDYVAWGSPGFAALGKFLAEHKGEELVNLYVGDVDAILVPDGQIFCHSDLSRVIDPNEAGGYYAFFRAAGDHSVYVPE